MSKLSFFKYQGAGNDFILIDSRHFSYSFDLSLFAQRVCARRSGIGADGLIFFSPSPVADYKMRIFNADGSEALMCGNGIRCLFDFIKKKEKALTIETLYGILNCRYDDDEIVIGLGNPKILHWPIAVEKKVLFVVDTGVPHAILFVDDLDQVDVSKEGAKIRFHPLFSPNGVNVNFVSINTKNQVVLRTYERGVEAETLACGTGAAAAAFVAMEYKALNPPISVLTRLCFEKNPIEYRQDLRFHFYKDDEGKVQIEMHGKAQKVFEGFIDFNQYAFNN